MSYNLSPIDAIARWASYAPERLALTGGGLRLTYGELDRRINATAALLTRELGLVRGDRVAILAHNHPLFFQLMYACVRTGIILVPLNFRLAPSELAGVLNVCRPRLLLFAEEFRAVADGLTWGGDPGVSAPVRLDVGRLAASEEASCEAAGPWQGARMEEPVLLLFTSGTTGLPKAAIIPARQIFWNAVNTGLAFELTGRDSTVLYTPLFHTGAINVLGTPLFHVGGCVHVHDGFNTERIVAALAEERVSTLFGVPVTLQMLADHPAFLDTARRHLRLCLCGGAPLPVSLIHRYAEAGVRLTQGFGMTEVGPNCFFLPPEVALARAGSVGKPIHYALARVTVAGQVASPGEVGELELSGPHVCLGYFRNEAESGKALVGEWFRTGDLARTDADGFYYVAGRRKDMFISGGENVYPAEVEVVLMGHPNVRDCAVVPVPDVRWGEVGCAFLVTDGSALTAETLRPWLKARLAGYKIPKFFVRRDELPRNQSGKVVKAELAKEAQAHVAG
jgi:fatty-acyl-CoA synthase